MSRVVRGIVFTRSAAGIVSQATDAKVAAYTADVDYTFTETKVCARAVVMRCLSSGRDKQSLRECGTVTLLACAGYGAHQLGRRAEELLEG